MRRVALPAPMSEASVRFRLNPIAQSTPRRIWPGISAAGPTMAVFTRCMSMHPRQSSNDTNIFVRFSDNNGTTWSAPVRVNDDATSNSQIQPAIAVDQNHRRCRRHVVRRPQLRHGYDTHRYLARSPMTAVSRLAPIFEISTGTISCLVDASFNCGDYDKMTYANGSFWRSWADNSNSTGDNPNGTTALDIYTAQVTVACGPRAIHSLLFASSLVVSCAAPQAVQRYEVSTCAILVQGYTKGC